MGPFLIALAALAALQLPGLRRGRPSDRAALALGLGLLVAGVAQFAPPETLLAGLPRWTTPGAPRPMAAVSLVIALGLLLPWTRRLAGALAAVLFLALWPLGWLPNFGVAALAGPEVAPALRFVAQPVLLVWSGWVAFGHFPGLGLRRWMMATAYDRAQLKYDAWIADRKRALLGGLRGTVLEVGPGTGVNFAYFEPSVDWIGIEPNPHMRKRLSAKARLRGLEPEFRELEVESGTGRLAVADHSVDAVVATLVQCSLPDPEQFLREVRRVLVPGGSFVFIDHVAAPRGTRLRRLQAWLSPLWQFMADGCHPDRELGDVIRAAGFGELELEEFRVPSECMPRVVSPQIAGVARTATTV